MAVEPVVVHDFSKQPGQTVQLDRYRFWGKPGTKESRERTADQTLGSASARNIVKDKDPKTVFFLGVDNKGGELLESHH